MTIIKTNPLRHKKTVKTIIRSDVLREIEAYCQWAGIFDIGFFIEDIASQIFRKDKQWTAYVQEKKLEKTKEE